MEAAGSTERRSYCAAEWAAGSVTAFMGPLTRADQSSPAFVRGVASQEACLSPRHL